MNAPADGDPIQLPFPKMTKITVMSPGAKLFWSLLELLMLLLIFIMLTDADVHGVAGSAMHNDAD